MVVLAVGLDEDEAEEGRGGFRCDFVLGDGALLAVEGVLGSVPCECIVFGGRPEVDVGVDDGEDEGLVLVRHGCLVLFFC